MNNKIKSLQNRIEKYIPYEFPDNNRGFIPASVLVPLLIKDGEFELLFTKRTDSLNLHKGEVSFPGGRLEDNDKSLLDCALRETEEEIGLGSQDIRILGALDETPVISNHKITPYVGIIPHPFKFVPNPDEVDKVFTVPIKKFMNPDLHSIAEHNYLDMVVPIHYYNVAEDIVWGATARIVTNLLEVAFEFVPEKYSSFLQKHGDPRTRFKQ